MPTIVLLGTFDTKLEELLYLREQILHLEAKSTRVILVDVGRSHIKNDAIDVTQETLTTKYAPPSRAQDLKSLPRGEVIKYMTECGSKWLSEIYNAGCKDPKQAIHGIISAGGTGGTSLSSAIFKAALPIGFPKLIVSTAASGDTGPIVGEMDITLMYSVVDIAGTNSLLKRVLSNAAGAIVGMAKSYEQSLTHQPSQANTQRKKVGLTMFGVTTPCVDKVREYLESNCDIECFVFHCTGHGGKAMERLISQQELDAVLDITTTEICDHLCGGVMSAGPNRLEAGLRAGIPYVISLGATDIVNFGPKATVPEKYQERKLFEHNPTVTLMRTSPAECEEIGKFIVDKIEQYARDKTKVQVVLPKGGVSIIASPDAPFYDDEADKALFAAIENGLQHSHVEVVKDQRAINDEGFACDIATRLISLMGLRAS